METEFYFQVLDDYKSGRLSLDNLLERRSVLFGMSNDSREFREWYGAYDLVIRELGMD